MPLLNKIFPYLTIGLVVFILLIPKVALFTISGGYSTPIRIEDLLIAAAVLVGLYLVITDPNYRDRARKVAQSPISLLIFLLIALMFISTTFNFIGFGLTANAFLVALRFVEYFIFFYLGYLGVASTNLHGLFLRVLVLTSVPLNLYGVLQRMGLAGGFGGGFYQYDYIKGTDRAFSTFSGPYELAGFLIVVIPVSVAMILTAQKFSRKAGHTIIWALAVIALAFSGARFPVFAVVPAVLSLVLVAKAIKPKLTLITLATLTLVVPFFLSDTLVTRFSPIVTAVRVSVEEYEKVSRERKAIRPTKTPTPTPAPSLTPKTIAEETREGEVLQTPAPGELEEAPIQSPTETPEKKSPTKATSPSKIVQVVGHITSWVGQKRTAVATSLSNSMGEASSQLEFFSSRLQEKDPSLRWRLGETWPRAIVKLKGNPLLGGGMGSVGIGLDGEYATLLGEIGLLGLGIFLALLTMVGLILKREIAKEDDHKEKVLLFVTIAVLLGIALDGIFVDIFRASKIAILFWYLVGLSVANRE